MKNSRTIDGVVHSIDKHTQRRLKQRGISLDMIWETCEDPDVVIDTTDKEVTYKVSKYYEGVELIVLMAALDGYVRIKTVYFYTEPTDKDHAKLNSKRAKRKEIGKKRKKQHHDFVVKRKQKAIAKRKRNSNKAKR